MHPAKHWQKKDDKVQCTLCPQNCVISERKKGFCKARKNVDGKLVSLVYGRPVATNIDPIEKKPLYHFLPGSISFSIGTAGCNFACEHCQNYDISCADAEEVRAVELSPEDVVKIAVDKKCQSISYTYNEPTIFFEYVVECAKLAKKAGIKNILVTNGYINPEPAKEFCRYIDAANVDLKAFDEDFYSGIAKAKLAPVLDTLKIYKKCMWLEVTNLIIDGKNDDMGKIEEMCRWLRDNLGKDVPLHFSRAFPMHNMMDIIPTPENTLLDARKVAHKYLDYVYIGNADLESNTYCPKCGGLLISRKYFSIISDLKGNKCGCGREISGIF